MSFPLIPNIRQAKEMVTTFGGYVNKASCKEGSFSFEKNITTENFPLLAERRRRGYIKTIEDYQGILEKNDNELLKNVKSVKYLETRNYHKMLDFLMAAPFQVLIMGHSCGNSDRTLLNTLFEHKNCISIKPYYHQKADGSDNYLDIIQNISRNFTDMKRMRDRVVNKTLCEPLPQANS